MSRESFIKYTKLSKGTVPAVKGITGHRAPIDVGKIRVLVVINNYKKDLILINIIYILGILLNLISIG